MNVFIIPSWYPSDAHPSTGIFFKEQAIAIAKARPDWQIGLCLWGSHEPQLWLEIHKPLESFLKLSSRLPFKVKDEMLEPNCVEFFSPARTWSRKLRKGNIGAMIRACGHNLDRHTQYFGKPDVIHAHVAHPGGYIAMHLSQKYGVPYVVTEHMSPFPMDSYRRDFSKWLLPPLQKADKVLAVSDALVANLKEHNIDAQLSSNFIDDSYFQPSPQTSSEIFTFIAVGRLEQQKNYGLMLQALAQLKETKQQFKLLIVGSGSKQTRLTKLANGLGLADHITWLGECDRSEVLSALQSADALLSTSLHENQPVAMLEAMACGLPILTARWSGSETFITDEFGSVLDFDATVISSAMAELIAKNPCKKGAVRSAFLEKYGVEMQVRRLEEVYEGLV